MFSLSLLAVLQLHMGDGRLNQTSNDNNTHQEAKFFTPNCELFTPGQDSY